MAAEEVGSAKMAAMTAAAGYCREYELGVTLSGPSAGKLDPTAQKAQKAQNHPRPLRFVCEVTFKSFVSFDQWPPKGGH